MEFRNLRYFLAVYEELSLTGASKRCFVAQPSISAAIQQLESELDCELFIRHPRGVSPTRAGNNLYPYAQKVISDIESLKDLFKDKTQQIQIRMALMPFLSGQRISLIIKEMMAMLPTLDLTIVDINDGADLRILSSNMVNPDETFHRLWLDKYVLATPIGHPLSVLAEVPIHMLNGVPFISRQPCDMMDSWQFALQKSNITLDTKATVRTEEYALDLVAAGLGVSLIPSQSAGTRSDIVTCEISDFTLERVVGLAYVKDHPIPAALLKAIEQAKKSFNS